MGRTTHFEVMADDPEKVSRFYSGVFGLNFRKNLGDYTLVNEGCANNLSGAVRKRSGRNLTGMPTIRVQNLHSAMDSVIKNGGRVVVPAKALPNLGWMAYCEDPEGNAFSIFAPDNRAF